MAAVVAAAVVGGVVVVACLKAHCHRMAAHEIRSFDTSFDSLDPKG